MVMAIVGDVVIMPLSMEIVLGFQRMDDKVKDS
jgi:hypothetical protein